MSFPSADDAWRQWTSSNVKKFKVSIYGRFNGSGVEYECFAANAKIPEGFAKLTPQPPYPSSDDPRAGTKAAMKELDAKHGAIIEKACRVAVELVRKNLTTHSREVRKEMALRGLVGPDTGREFWLGRAMNKLAAEGIIKEVGRFKYSDESRNIHERNIALWALVDEADTSAYPKLEKAEKEEGK